MQNNCKCRIVHHEQYKHAPNDVSMSGHHDLVEANIKLRIMHKKMCVFMCLKNSRFFYSFLISENPANKNFLSWGNSWMRPNCGWRGALYDHLNMSINLPIITRGMFDCPPGNTVITLKPTSSPTPPPTGK